MPYTDTFLYDIKAIDSARHKELVGKENGVILDNLVHLSEKGASIEIRIPLVTGYNDMEISKIGEFLKDLKGIKKVKILRYHNLAASRYEALGIKNTLPDAKITAADVERAVALLRSFGLHAVSN